MKKHMNDYEELIDRVIKVIIGISIILILLILSGWIL